jgi:phage shock protein A
LASLHDALGLNVRRFGATATEAEHSSANPAIQKVITMLENLVSEIDAETAQDEKQFTEFTAWCTKQQAATGASIDALNTKIQTLTAALGELYAEKEKLEKQIAQLKTDIATTRKQINMATQKRGEEHDSFVKEQTDFDNSISACKKAVDILKQHYGEPQGPLVKPDFMGLVQTKDIIRKAVERRGMKVHPKILSFIQSKQPGERYGDKRGDAMSIVDQMQLLADTFADDKQSAIDEEDRLQKLYTTLMTEKTAQLNTLTAELDSRQSVLNSVNQDIAEKESAKAIAEAELKDEQAYLSQTTKTCDDTTLLYNMRKKDRQEEKVAVTEAIKVLEPQTALIQLDDSAAILHKGKDLGKHLGKNRGKHLGKHLAKHRSHDKTGHKIKHLTRHRGRSHHRSHHRRQTHDCPGCHKAASLLSQAAKLYQSDMLAAASAAVQGSDALKDVITSLGELIRRIEEEQNTETQHKEWCEGELSTTRHKKETHEGHVEDLKQKIADEIETVAEKKQAIIDNSDAISRADANFNEATRIRQTEKEAFDVELQNLNDAIAALNQAIDILAKHYAKTDFLQESTGVAPREMAPGVFDDVYEKKGGSGVVQMISVVRNEFNAGKSHLEKGEAQAIKDYQDTKASYQQARQDLVSNGDKLTVEKQTAEANLAQFRDDKSSHEDEIGAATTYLGQLSGSCESLLQHFDERVKLRNEEKEAIRKAINVLENEA